MSQHRSPQHFATIFQKEPGVDIRQLKYFIAVAEEKNISRAAERLHISQPPLTRHIHALEEELGTQLFLRTTWGVKLTPAGQALQEHALKIKTLVEQTREHTRNAGKMQDSTLHIGIFGSAMLTVAPKILNVFAEEHPQINVVLHHQPRAQQIEALRKGQILAAFDRYHAPHPDIETCIAWQERQFLAINRNHPAAQQAFIRYSDLQNLPMIGPMDAEATAFVEARYRQHGIEPKFVHRASDMVSAVHLVASGFGCSTVPESLQVLQLPDVVYRPMVADHPLLIHLHCAWLAGNTSPLLAALLDTVQRYRQTHCQI